MVSLVEPIPLKRTSSLSHSLFQASRNSLFLPLFFSSGHGVRDEKSFLDKFFFLSSSSSSSLCFFILSGVFFLPPSLLK